MHQVYISWTENIIFPRISMDFSYHSMQRGRCCQTVGKLLRSCRHVWDVIRNVLWICVHSKLKVEILEGSKCEGSQQGILHAHLSSFMHVRVLCPPSSLVKLSILFRSVAKCERFEHCNKMFWTNTNWLIFSMMNVKIQSSFTNKHYKKQYNLPGSFRLTNTFTFKSSHHFG